MAGMSIDYVKCFHLIPQAVVLAVALELGMDPGTCRALGAMYKPAGPSRSPGPSVAGGGPPTASSRAALVGDLGECPHHDL